MSHREDLGSRSILQEGMVACSIDPGSVGGSLVLTSGTPIAVKVRALKSSAVTHVICAVQTAVVTGPLTTALVDVCDIAGTQLSLSADKSGSTGVGDFGGAASDKAIVVPSFNAIEGSEYIIRVLFVVTAGSTPALVRANASSVRGLNSPRVALGLGGPYRFMVGNLTAQTTLATFDSTTYLSSGIASSFLLGLAP